MNGRLRAQGSRLRAPHAVRFLTRSALMLLIALAMLAPAAHAQPQEVVE